MAEDNHKIPSTTLVIFGVSGALSKRKLLPALVQICQSTEIRANLQILGLSRRPISIKDVLSGYSSNLSGQFELMQIDYSQPDSFKELKKKLHDIGSEQVIFYFAVPPEAVLPIVENLGKSSLNTANHRLLMEKPFGIDLSSAKKLIKESSKYFDDKQIYRIDHYLAKEMAQNIAVFLAANSIFRRVWNNDFIEKIEIISPEDRDIEDRVDFYEQTGALRDGIQSHLLQLLALVLMKPCPDIFDFSQVPARRLEALNQIEPADPNKAIRGQYAGYALEVGNQSSNTETFVYLELTSRDPVWRGVPLVLTTGKALDKKSTEIKVHFKKAAKNEANLLTIRVQPNEGIELDLWVKKPGYENDLQKLQLEFNYSKSFNNKLPEAYEQIIVDAIRSRQNLFASSDEVIASWKIFDNLLNVWQGNDRGLVEYEKGNSTEQILSL